MSTKTTPEATIETFPRWASQVNGVSCQTLDHPNGHQTKAKAEACQATRVRALIKASDGNTQDLTPEIISFPRFYVLTSAGQPCQHYIAGDSHKVGHKDQAKAEKCMGVTQPRIILQAWQNSRSRSETGNGLNGHNGMH